MKHFPLLEQWSVQMDDRNPYLAPELCKLVLTGHVVGHPLKSDGPITTSELLAIDLNDRTAKTASRFYCLGEPHPEYVKWCRENGKKLSGYFEKSEAA